MAPPADWTGDHDWVTTRQASVYLQVHIRTVQRWVRDGDIEGAKVGGRLRLRRVDVEKLLDDSDEREFPYDPLGPDGPDGRPDREDL